jgi:hypothetical protein
MACAMPIPSLFNAGSAEDAGTVLAKEGAKALWKNHYKKTFTAL